MVNNNYINWKKRDTVKERLKYTKFRWAIQPVDINIFISPNGELLYEKFEKWEKKTVFSAEFYEVSSFEIKNTACGGYYNVFKLAYTINLKNLELKYLDEETLNCFDSEKGDIYELTVSQFEELLLDWGYKKLKINIESDQKFFRWLTNLQKDFKYIIPSYDGFWVNFSYDDKGKLWKFKA